MQGIEENNTYSPVPNLNNIYSPKINNSSYDNNIQQIDGLNNLHPEVRTHALSALNSIPNNQSVDNSNFQMNNQFTSLPTMHDFQNQNINTNDFLPQMMQQQQMMQYPSINEA